VEAKLYLPSLYQDIIDEVPMAKWPRWLRTWCCDRFCCVLDFSSEILNLVLQEKNWMRWYIRKEDFGALLWNPATNRVYELDDEACTVLMALQEGRDFEKVSEEYGVQASGLLMLLAEISKTTEPPVKKYNTKRGDSCNAFKKTR